MNPPPRKDNPFGAMESRVPNSAETVEDSRGAALREELAPIVEEMGVEKFRVGGTSGGWQLLFGAYAELSEETLPLEAFACSACHRVELRVPTS